MTASICETSLEVLGQHTWSRHRLLLGPTEQAKASRRFSQPKPTNQSRCRPIATCKDSWSNPVCLDFLSTASPPCARCTIETSANCSCSTSKEKWKQAASSCTRPSPTKTPNFQTNESWAQGSWAGRRFTEHMESWYKKLKKIESEILINIILECVFTVRLSLK